VIRVDVWLRAGHLAAERRQPQLAWQEGGFLDEVAKRIEWSRTNRHLFERPTNVRSEHLARSLSARRGSLGRAED
jgi:hypothetical protein